MFHDEPWLAPSAPVAALAGAPRSIPRLAAAKRQDELLDEALKETFPASDPVSVVRIN